MKDPCIDKLFMIPPQPTDFASKREYRAWWARYAAMKDAAVTPWQRALRPGACFVTKPYCVTITRPTPNSVYYGELLPSGRERLGKNERRARLFMDNRGHVCSIHLSDISEVVSREEFVEVTTIEIPRMLAGEKQGPSMFVMVQESEFDGSPRFALSQGLWQWGSATLTVGGLVQLLQYAGFDPEVHQLLCSSSVDFPHDYGAPLDFDGRLVVAQAKAIVSGRTPPAEVEYPPCVPRPEERSSEEETQDKDPAGRLP